jgi:metallo-beta-lactamase class B
MYPRSGRIVGGTGEFNAETQFMIVTVEFETPEYLLIRSRLERETSVICSTKIVGKMKMSCLKKAVFALAVVSFPIHVPAQEPQAPNITKEELAKDNRLFITMARKALKWDEPTEPVKIVGPLHYVGTAGLASYLFATSEGHILFNTGMPESGPLIEAAIRKLGFDPKDIKIIINGHGHSDHAGAFSYFKQLTGAQIAIMKEDVSLIEDGGKSDFHYGQDWQIMGQPPVKVDRILRDGDTVRLGDVILTAHLTPGHTRGATTWETTLVDDGKAYHIVWPDGGGFNPGYKIAGNPTSYPGMTEDYRRTHHFWEMQKPDIFLAAHAEWFSFEKKSGRMQQRRALRHG